MRNKSIKHSHETMDWMSSQHSDRMVISSFEHNTVDINLSSMKLHIKLSIIIKTQTQNPSNPVPFYTYMQCSNEFILHCINC